MAESKNERSASGAPIYRHSAADARSELVGGVSSFTEAIETHIDRHFSNRGPVYHELVSDLIHLDIERIEPTVDRPFTTLITNGMSSLPMNIPKGAEQYRYAELVLSLPPDWPLTQEALKNDRYYWPIRWLKELARLPHRYNSWLWATHTVPNGNPPQPFADNTKLCCALILVPLLVPPSFHSLEVAPNTTIRFLSFVPIYKEEMDLKLRKGLDPLLPLFEKAQVSELLDIHRPNTVKRGLFG